MNNAHDEARYARLYTISMSVNWIPNSRKYCIKAAYIWQLVYVLEFYSIYYLMH